MIIFDEKKYAEQMLKKGFTTKNRNVYELHILAKYYFYIGKEKEEVKELLIKFCNKHIEYFNMDEWFKIINRTISVASRGTLITGKQVEITKNELNAIQQQEDIREQKLLFTMLVLYKFYDYNRFKTTLKDLFELSDLITVDTNTRLKLLHSLTNKELIDIDMRGRRWAKFVDSKSEVVIVINDFEDVIFHYLNHIGNDKFDYCTGCKRIIKITTGNKIRCEECRVDKQKEWQRNSMKKIRKNVK